MLPEGPSARIREVDGLKGLAILGVIGIHAAVCYMPSPPAGALSWLLINSGLFLEFAVPLFVLLSGFLLYHRHGGDLSAGRFYARRAASILPPYVFFSLFYIAGKQLLFGPMTALQMVYGLLTASGSYHLWFIAVIAELYLLYPLIARLYRRAAQSGLVPPVLIACWGLQAAWNAIYLTLVGSGDLAVAGIIQRVFITQAFYFVAGMYLADNPGIVNGLNVKMRYLAPAAVLLTLAVAFLTKPGFFLPGLYPDVKGYAFVLYLAEEALRPLLNLTAFALCHKLVTHAAGRGKSALGSLGKYSFGMYLIHVAFMPLLCIGLDMAGIRNTGLAFYIILFGLTVLLSYASIYLLSFLPHSALLVGAHNDPGGAQGL